VGYFPHSSSEIDEMLRAVGKKSIDDFFKNLPYQRYIPAGINALGEKELVEYFEKIVEKNVRINSSDSFIGGGVYRHFLPVAVDYLILRGEFFTSYTPYQPEASQGTLQAIFEFQTAVAGLFDMDVANASMYDGSTSTAEAALMAERINRKGRFFISSGLHPEYRQVLKTYLQGSRGYEVIELPIGDDGKTDFKNVNKSGSAIIIQSPNFFGCIEDLKQAREVSKSNDLILISVCTEPLSLAILKPPGSYNVDIAVGEGQSLSSPPSFGGPYLGLFTTKKEYIRQMPGRLVGETIDADGKRGYVLTLATREQHIIYAPTPD